MKKIKALFLLLAPVLFLSACSSDDVPVEVMPDPTASFTFESVADNPQLVSFTNTSEAAEDYLWDFGDASDVSTEKHPTHLYAEAGVYTVTLTAINEEGKTETSQEVNVIGLPVAAFSFETDPEDAFNIVFENLSSNSQSYRWDFGDGSEVSTEASPSHTYAAPGTYTVTLSATGEGGTAESSMQVQITEAQPAYDQLYLLGDGSLNGWNLGSPAEAFVQDEENPFEFSLETLLVPGDLKIATYTGDFCDGDWLHPAAAAQDLPEADAFEVFKGCEGPDNKWRVTEETGGRYRILVDLETQSISFEKLTAPFTELYALGDAVPNGWNLGNPSEGFVKDETDPFLFTYQVNLTPGEFKISTYTGDFCDAAWLHPTEAAAPITTGSIEAHQGCTGPDNKWQVTEETQGAYLITVDLYTNTIAFQPL